MKITAKSAAALVLAALISIGAATTSQASTITPMSGGATGCCRTIN